MIQDPRVHTNTTTYYSLLSSILIIEDERETKNIHVELVRIVV